MPETVSAPPSNAQWDRSFFGHPRGLSTLFFTEMWERFSYYGMRALLILFMTATVQKGGLGFTTSKAGSIYGLYTAMVFLLSLPGGWIADRITGQRRAVLWGGVIIAAGHFSMAFPRIDTFYLGLALIVIGTGLLKPNVSTMVGALYSEDDVRRDAGFSIFYMGINIGAHALAAGLRLSGRKHQLALWIRRGRHWDDARPDSIRRGRQISGRGGAGYRGNSRATRRRFRMGLIAAAVLIAAGDCAHSYRRDLVHRGTDFECLWRASDRNRRAVFRLAAHGQRLLLH